MRTFYLAVLVLFAALIIIFALQNLQAADVSFLGMSFHTRLATLIAGIYVLGAVTGGGVFALVRHSFEQVKQGR